MTQIITPSSLVLLIGSKLSGGDVSFSENAKDWTWHLLHSNHVAQPLLQDPGSDFFVFFWVAQYVVRAQAIRLVQLNTMKQSMG